MHSLWSQTHYCKLVLSLTRARSHSLFVCLILSLSRARGGSLSLYTRPCLLLALSPSLYPSLSLSLPVSPSALAKRTEHPCSLIQYAEALANVFARRLVRLCFLFNHICYGFWFLLYSANAFLEEIKNTTPVIKITTITIMTL